MNKIIAYQPFIWGPLLLKGEITTHDTSYSRSVTNVFEHLKLGFSDDHDSSWGPLAKVLALRILEEFQKSFFFVSFSTIRTWFFSQKNTCSSHNLSNKTVDCTHNVSLQLITNFLGVCFSHSCSLPLWVLRPVHVEKKAAWIIPTPEGAVQWNWLNTVDRTFFQGSLCQWNLVTHLVVKMSWSWVIFMDPWFKRVLRNVTSSSIPSIPSIPVTTFEKSKAFRHSPFDQFLGPRPLIRQAFLVVVATVALRWTPRDAWEIDPKLFD